MKKLAILLVSALLISCSPKEPEAATVAEKEIKKISIETLELQAVELKSYVEVKGSIEAVQDAYISPEVNGQIKSISVKRGQTVKKGDLLIRLNTDMTENSVNEAKISLALADKIFEKQEELWNKNIGSEIQYLEAKNGKDALEARLDQLETQLKLAYIRAPYAGIVDEILVKTGELASPGMRLARLVNLDEMRMSAQVSESYLNSVELNDDVTLKFESYPEKIMKEKISRIGTVIDPLTRTFVVDVELENINQKLKPNMLSSMMIQDYYNAEALVVPSIIIRQDFQGDFLYRVKKTEQGFVAEKVYIQIGKTVEDQTKVESGIESGDQIIVKGYNLVGDGSPVNISN